MTTPKYPTSFHLSAAAKQLLKRLADELGVSQAAVLELAIRDYAKQHGASNEKA